MPILKHSIVFGPSLITTIVPQYLNSRKLRREAAIARGKDATEDLRD